MWPFKKKHKCRGDAISGYVYRSPVGIFTKVTFKCRECGGFFQNRYPGHVELEDL